MEFLTEERINIVKAYSKFLQEVKNPQAIGKNDLYKNSKYAPLDYSLTVLREMAKEHGIGIMQDASQTEHIETGNGMKLVYVSVCTMLVHDSGEIMKLGSVKVPAWQLRKDGGIRIDAQTIGAAYTYARRYSLEMACGVASDKDDDANSLVQPQGDNYQQPQQQYNERPSATNKASEKQIAFLKSLIKKEYGDIAKGFANLQQMFNFSHGIEQLNVAQATQLINKLKAGGNNGN